MPAPQGEMLSFDVDGREIEVLIEPTIYSRRSIDALCRYYRSTTRASVWQDIKDLALTPDMPADIRQDIKSEYMQLLKKAAMPGFQEATEALQTTGGLQVALEVNSNLTHADAKAVVDNIPNLLDLLRPLLSVGAEEMELAKNY